MRMRKKKWADSYLLEHDDYALSDPSSWKGKWKKNFHCEILHVEIGMGKGDYLNDMASMYSEEGWVGIEKDHSAAAVACKKTIEEKKTYENQRMIVGDASQMEEWFAPNEIDVIHLNFSDPWPKKYTHKRRLSSNRFLEMYRILLSDEGKIQMKTDNKDLFEDSVHYFLDANYELLEFSVDYRRKEHPEDAYTEYERRFLELGQPIYFLVAKPSK